MGRGRRARRKKGELVRRVRLNNRDPEAWFEFGLFEYDHGEPSTAEKCFKRALDLSDNKHAQSLAYLGVMRLDEGRYIDSERLMRRALALDPDSAYLMGLLSAALCSLKRYDESLDLIRKATEMDPENAAAWHQLAVVLHVTGDLIAGEKAARRSLGIDPKNADHWVTLGVNLEKQERLAEAEDAYRTSVRIDPYFPMGHKCLEQLYLKTGRFEDAEMAWFPDLGEFAKSLSPEERTRLMDYVKIGEEALRENVESMYLDDEPL